MAGAFEVGMGYFPLPYPHELIYSMVARAGVHLGITSPKQLLDEVFANRKVIATIDLPCHLNSLLPHFPKSSGLNIELLVYKHTLFPLFSPFVEEGCRKRCLRWMSGLSQGATHLALGIAASRVKQIRILRYCPACQKAQFTRYGEYYWDRRWQVTGADCCYKHGPLFDAQVGINRSHRHKFFSASPKSCPVGIQGTAMKESRRVAKQIIELLECSPGRSPTQEQWTRYYHELVRAAGCNRGKHIDYEKIKDRLYKRWSSHWLIEYGL